jgi:hypothetical protein
LTSIKVNPRPALVTLDDPELFNYPFLYMLEIRNLDFYPDEVETLRRYLENGGFLMVDDFWGEAAYWNLYDQLKRVFPNEAQEPRELDIDHPIFHTVYDITEKPQIPNIHRALDGRPYGITWERDDARSPYYKGVFDDKGRMMVLICQNTDLGDGWEREGVDPWYFKEFSEKKAYPMGINILVYAMTH